MRNPCLDAALAELDAVGIRDYQLARGSKHLQVRWTVAGVLRMMIIPGSPSDWRSPANTRRDMRRLLREDGLLETNGQHAAEPDPDQWRRQLEDLIQQLNRMNVPEQARAERSEIVAALRKLLDRTIQQKENGNGAKGAEVDGDHAGRVQRLAGCVRPLQ
jgi:hypothetical protein